MDTLTLEQLRNVMKTHDLIGNASSILESAIANCTLHLQKYQKYGIERLEVPYTQADIEQLKKLLNVLRLSPKLQKAETDNLIWTDNKYRNMILQKTVENKKDMLTINNEMAKILGE
jgi:hypothetical protein